MSKKIKTQMIEIGTKQYPIVKQFTIPRVNWEMDNYGFVVHDEDHDKNRLVLTKHTRAYFAEVAEVYKIQRELANYIDEMTCATILLQAGSPKTGDGHGNQNQGPGSNGSVSN